MFGHQVIELAAKVGLYCDVEIIMLTFLPSQQRINAPAAIEPETDICSLNQVDYLNSMGASYLLFRFLASHVMKIPLARPCCVRKPLPAATTRA